MQKPIETKIEGPAVTLPEPEPTSEDDFAKLVFEFVDFSKVYRLLDTDRQALDRGLWQLDALRRKRPIPSAHRHAEGTASDGDS